MKVILLQDVAKIGRRSQIVEVPTGYAMNQLIPKKMAEPATAVNQKRIERIKAGVSASNEAIEAKFAKTVSELKDKTIKVEVEANEIGHTFKAVSEADIISSAKTVGVDIEVNMISIKTPIKSVGEHKIDLVCGQNKSDFNIEVVKK